MTNEDMRVFKIKPFIINFLNHLSIYIKDYLFILLYRIRELLDYYLLSQVVVMAIWNIYFIKMN